MKTLPKSAIGNRRSAIASRIPAKTGRLNKDEVATIARRLSNRAITLQEASTGAMTMHVNRANRWRDSYNPMRGLTITRAVSMIEDGERGAYADLQWLYRKIEKSDPTLRGCKRRILSAIKRLDWEIKTTPEEKLPTGATKAQADKQAVDLRTAYDGIDNLRRAIEFLVLSEFRGFSHLEPWENADGDVTHLEPVPQWHWCRDGINGEWRYDAEARSGNTTKGESIADKWMLIREIEDPIDEIALLGKVRKNLGEKDYDGFLEVYGIPWLFIVGPPNVPSTKEAEYQAIAEDVVADGRGYLPNGTEVKTASGDTRGTNPFLDYLRHIDEQIVLAATSGKLTMLTSSTGLNSDQGDTHEETFKQIAIALAMDVSEVFQKQFDMRILAKRHDGEPILAYFEICAKEETDPGQIITEIKDLSTAGYQVEPGEVTEKTGYTVTVKETQAPGNFGTQALVPDALDRYVQNRVLKNRAKLSDDTKRFQDAALQMYAAARRERHEPMRNRIVELIANPTREGLEALRADLPDTMRKLGANTSLQKVFEETLAAAFVDGAVERAGAKS